MRDFYPPSLICLLRKPNHRKLKSLSFVNFQTPAAISRKKKLSERVEFINSDISNSKSIRRSNENRLSAKNSSGVKRRRIRLKINAHFKTVEAYRLYTFYSYNQPSGTAFAIFFIRRK
jgi:hypothetical protein